nr:SPOR domain-containing protein [Roseibium sp. CAU 1639]
MIVAAGVIGVAVLGGAGFFLFDADSVVVPSGPPPIISGLQEPLKIYPDQAQAPADDQAKLIYDRVGGNGVGGPDRLVLPESPQPAELPPAPAGTNSGAELVPGAPKRVRTVIVRPDGTFVSDDDQAAPAAAVPAPATPATNDAAPAADTDASRVVAATPIAPQTTDTPVSATDAPAISDAPAIVSGTDQPDAVPAVNEPAAPVPSVLPRKKPAAPVQVTSAPPATTAPAATAPAARNDGPLNLTPQASAPAAPAAPATPAVSGSTGTIAPGTYIVQVTSQRSAAAASDAYSGLQRRYPSVLGNRNAVIVAATVEDRGVFYRARIPTGSRDEAISLCESLQAAGGDCFVRRQP